MKLRSIWTLLVALLLGVAFGFGLTTWFSRPAVPEGTALLREFSFPDVAAKVGQTNWQVMEDRVYKPFPALARSRSIARRIVARAEMSDAELDRFGTTFQNTATKALEAFGAVSKAEFDLASDSTQIRGGAANRWRGELPRRYYAVNDVHGIADIWYIAEGGGVTVIVSLIEGP